MRGVFLFACLLATALALTAAPTARADSGSDGQFIGKGLEGWQGLEGLWSYKDGMLIGTSGKEGLKFNTFLCSKKKYRDFELKFQVRLKNGVGNSGVQIRSEVFKPDVLAVRGPQCDIGAVYWGSLYGEQFGGMMQASPKEVVTRVLKKDDFNDYHIRCVGKHVTIKLNGETTVDADFARMPDEGIIAFQLHAGPPMEVTYRNIEFKNLSK